jgi:hypothetical protein
LEISVVCNPMPVFRCLMPDTLNNGVVLYGTCALYALVPHWGRQPCKARLAYLPFAHLARQGYAGPKGAAIASTAGAAGISAW